MAYEGYYEREFTLTGLKNLKTVLDKSRGALNQTDWQTFMSSYGFTLIGLAATGPVGAAVGIASMLYAGGLNINAAYKSQLDAASNSVTNAIITMQSGGYTKCKGRGAAIYGNSTAFLPYNFGLCGLYKNGSWMTDM